MKVALDTNVLVSAATTRGLCTDVLREVLISHDLVLSEVLIEELEGILLHKFEVPSALVGEYIDVLKSDSITTGLTDELDLDLRDQSDIKILSAAASTRADIFVTGDKELLELGQLQKMIIVSPRQFWERVKIKSD